jgi:hypothetical protein
MCGIRIRDCARFRIRFRGDPPEIVVGERTRLSDGRLGILHDSDQFVLRVVRVSGPVTRLRRILAACPAVCEAGHLANRNKPSRRVIFKLFSLRVLACWRGSNDPISNCRVGVGQRAATAVRYLGGPAKRVVDRRRGCPCRTGRLSGCCAEECMMRSPSRSVARADLT